MGEQAGLRARLQISDGFAQGGREDGPELGLKIGVGLFSGFQMIFFNGSPEVWDHRNLADEECGGCSSARRSQN